MNGITTRALIVVTNRLSYRSLELLSC